MRILVWLLVTHPARFAAQFRAAATASANGKKGELRRMRDEYAALKRDLADKKSRR